ncbi:MAG TPA: hypothetical protein VGC81_08965 [Candidatus Methylomirabilis sp.]
MIRQVGKIPPDRGRGIRAAIGLALVLLAVWTAGCATMRGLGEDIQSLGRGIKKVFTDP